MFSTEISPLLQELYLVVASIDRDAILVISNPVNNETQERSFLINLQFNDCNLDLAINDEQNGIILIPAGNEERDLTDEENYVIMSVEKIIESVKKEV